MASTRQPMLHGYSPLRAVACPRRARLQQLGVPGSTSLAYLITLVVHYVASADHCLPSVLRKIVSMLADSGSTCCQHATGMLLTARASGCLAWSPIWAQAASTSEQSLCGLSGLVGNYRLIPCKCACPAGTTALWLGVVVHLHYSISTSIQQHSRSDIHVWV